MTVVLFCGGIGVRLRAAVQGIPKPLVTIGDRPILIHLMRWYAHHGHREFVLCLGTGGELIERHFRQCPERTQTERLPGGATRVHLRTGDFGDWVVTLLPTGATASIGQRFWTARSYVGPGPFLANYADGLSDLDLPDFVTRFAASGAVGGLISVRPPGSFHVVSADTRGLVESVVPLRDSGTRINGGFFVFGPEVFDWLVPGEDLADGLLPRLAVARALFSHAHEGFWACMDTVKDWQLLEGLATAGQTPWEPWAGRKGRSVVSDPASSG